MTFRSTARRRQIDPIGRIVRTGPFPMQDVMNLRTTALALIGAALAGALPALAEGPDDILPEAPAKALVVKGCTACHQAAVVVAKRRTAEDWDAMVGKMVDRGAPLTEDQQDQVYEYLV